MVAAKNVQIQKIDVHIQENIQIAENMPIICIVEVAKYPNGVAQLNGYLENNKFFPCIPLQCAKFNKTHDAKFIWW